MTECFAKGGYSHQNIDLHSPTAIECLRQSILAHPNDIDSQDLNIIYYTGHSSEVYWSR
jgi:hypothetical protein